MKKVQIYNILALVAAILWLGTAPPAHAQDSGFGPAFAKSVQTALGDDAALGAFYRARAYAPLWVDPQPSPNRAGRLPALMAALDAAPAHGLPINRYDAAALRAQANGARTLGDLGRLEVALSRAYLAYARDISSGALDPAQIDASFLREIPRPDPALMLAGMASAENPADYLRAMMPQNPAYSRLMAQKAALEQLVASGAEPEPIRARGLQPDESGDQVIALRNRLIDLGYLPQTASARYDGTLMRAVQRFQRDHGLNNDGVAGQSTLDMLNMAPSARLSAVIVALERMRWMGNTPLGARHIWVNQADFTAAVVDDGQVIFRTRTVIGKNVPDQRSPEFSDMMEYMAINPSWGVPRSITVKEYLPLLQSNPQAVGHLQLLDGRGRVVSREGVDFAAYTGRNFPFALRQPPSEGNALGVVKFMFPNPHNIYLHDTPAKNLFENEVRAYSHGCIRLGDPIALAHVLLGWQSDDPVGAFQTARDSGREVNISLARPIPVHLVYFTAYPDEGYGDVRYRADVYGRDAALFKALVDGGLELAAHSG